MSIDLEKYNYNGLYQHFSRNGIKHFCRIDSNILLCGKKRGDNYPEKAKDFCKNCLKKVPTSLTPNQMIQNLIQFDELAKKLTIIEQEWRDIWEEMKKLAIKDKGTLEVDGGNILDKRQGWEPVPRAGG